MSLSCNTWQTSNCVIKGKNESIKQTKTVYKCFSSFNATDERQKKKWANQLDSCIHVPDVTSKCLIPLTNIGTIDNNNEHLESFLHCYCTNVTNVNVCSQSFPQLHIWCQYIMEMNALSHIHSVNLLIRTRRRYHKRVKSTTNNINALTLRHSIQHYELHYDGSGKHTLHMTSWA